MVRKSLVETSQVQENTSFKGTYSWSKKTHMAIGDEQYVIPLDLENGLYQLPKHRLYGFTDADNKERNFRGNKYAPEILCKSYNADGEWVGEAECCKLQKEMWAKYPDSKDINKRLLSGKSWKIFIPVLILGNSVTTNASPKKVPIPNISIKTWDFSYLEMSVQGWNSLIKAVTEDLKNNYEGEDIVTDEQFLELSLKKIQNSIMKVSATKPDSGIAYAKMYSFISFKNKNIGKATNEYEAIVNYRNNKEVMNSITDFLTLFNAEVNNMVISDWTDEELKKFVSDANTATAKMDEIVSNAQTPEEEVYFGTKPIKATVAQPQPAYTMPQSAVQNTSPQPATVAVAEKPVADEVYETEPVSIQVDDVSYDIDSEDDFFGGSL